MKTEKEIIAIVKKYSLEIEKKS